MNTAERIIGSVVLAAVLACFAWASTGFMEADAMTRCLEKRPFNACQHILR